MEKSMEECLEMMEIVVEKMGNCSDEEDRKIFLFAFDRANLAFLIMRCEKEAYGSKKEIKHLDRRWNKLMKSIRERGLWEELRLRK